MIEEPFDSFDDFDNKKPIYIKEQVIEEKQEAVIEEVTAPEVPVQEEPVKTPAKRGRKKKEV